MKIEIDNDERYPDWFYYDREDGKAGPGWGQQVEVTEEEFSYFEKVKKDYNNMQDRLEELYKSAKHQNINT
jgi:hypothetical protein